MWMNLWEIIKTTKEGQDVFLHQEQILDGEGRKLRDGQAVRFHVFPGPEAWNVKVAEE